jgi:hypothetical protein
VRVVIVDDGNDMTPIVIPENTPWLNSKPTFNLEFTNTKI